MTIIPNSFLSTILYVCYSLSLSSYPTSLFSVPFTAIIPMMLHGSYPSLSLSPFLTLSPPLIILHYQYPSLFLPLTTILKPTPSLFPLRFSFRSIFEYIHCKDTVPKIQNKYSQKWNLPRPRSQFLHSCICERFIYSQDRSTWRTDRGNI